MARIMLIDDDTELTDNTAALLRQRGHDVSVGYTTLNAEERLQAENPDLLILDVMFPDNPVGGFDLARHIRRIAALRQLPIILLTGVNQHFPMDFSAADIDPDWMPIQAFLEKPLQLEKLVEVMDKMLNA